LMVLKKTCFSVAVIVLVFWSRVLLCSPGWPQTNS
jgi:hypothetical protein